MIIGSTGGGVFSRLASHKLVRDMTLEVIADRDCGILTVAKSNGIKDVLIPSRSGLDFSNQLLRRYESREDLIFLSFYTRLFQGEFIAQHRGRIFNCHPSLLPAFKGMNGFEDTLSSGAMFMGCTLHEIDSGMDTGRPVIQAAIPLDRAQSPEDNRHKVFLAQYYSTLQFIRWIHDSRLSHDKDMSFTLNGVNYEPTPFSPNLDADFFEFCGEKNAFASNQ